MINYLKNQTLTIQPSINPTNSNNPSNIPDAINYIGVASIVAVGGVIVVRLPEIVNIMFDVIKASINKFNAPLLPVTNAELINDSNTEFLVTNEGYYLESSQNISTNPDYYNFDDISNELIGNNTLHFGYF